MLILAALFDSEIMKFLSVLIEINPNSYNDLATGYNLD